MKYLKATLNVTFWVTLLGYLAIQYPAGIYLRSTLSVVQVIMLAYDKELGYPAPVSSGSGVFIDTKGAVLTAAHVVRKSPFCVVEYQGKMITYKRVAYDKKRDLALLRPYKDKVASLPIPVGYIALPGEKVYTMGYPGDFEQLFSVGHMLGYAWERMIVSAPIAHGSSGGPILSNNGFIVGIVSAYATPVIQDRAWQGYTLGASVNSVRDFLRENGAL